ncbi:WbqC family protein [Croceimicrobium sp.]|uniref:WbqC family protein n=1 Tax=Croceimicrobium sp. TaxID=2828340 RepID=UPI003BAB519D
MILAVHQPNFMPWQGYFKKMKDCDQYILMDTVQYVHRHICNRNKFKNSQGEAQWLGVSVSHSKGRDVSFIELAIDYSQKWQSKALNSLKHAYGKAPYFDQYYPQIEKILLTEYPNLAALNIEIIEFFRGVLKIDTPMQRMSNLPGDLGTKSEQIINLCKIVGADQYLSGQGAKKYNDLEAYQAANIELLYQEYEPPVYKQMGDEFISHLSVIDLIMCEGDNAGDFI